MGASPRAGPNQRRALCANAVMLSPFAEFTLSEANGLRVNSAKHPYSPSLDAKGKKQLHRSFAPTSRGSG